MVEIYEDDLLGRAATNEELRKLQREYRNYRRRARALYGDTPLSYRKWLAACQRWDKEYDKLWKHPDTYWGRIEELERLLAV